MKRRVFFSFHYKPDNWRASQVRNAGIVEGNQPVADNDWETVTKGGDAAIQKWIDEQLSGRSCSVVLIGRETAGRKWINYEIIKSWDGMKGVVGVYIHRLKDIAGNQGTKGHNPFDGITLGTSTGPKLSNLVKAYDPPYSESKDAYKYIADNIQSWVDEAIAIRSKLS